MKPTLKSKHPSQSDSTIRNSPYIFNTGEARYVAKPTPQWVGAPSAKYLAAARSVAPPCPRYRVTSTHPEYVGRSMERTYNGRAPEGAPGMISSRG
jgi:hypothetical protein